MRSISSPASGELRVDISRRDPAHDLAIDTLAAYLRKTGMPCVAGTTTANRKRPDLASLLHDGTVVVWEVKTRFAAAETRNAWAKYHQSCHALYMVYPAAALPNNWPQASWLPQHPLFQRVGVLLFSGEHCVWARHPTRHSPRPDHLEHLTRSIQRRTGSHAPKTNAQGSSSA